MIPTFPEFKALEVSDRAAVEAHTHRFPPYSDFNFTSLWAWDTSGERMVSELNGNLAVRFTDYSTHEPFLSFLGTNDVEHTARTLLDYCKENKLPATLKLMPEVSVHGMRATVLRSEEDRNNFDYIYSVAQHAAFIGADYKRSRNFLNTFMREYPSARTEIVDLADVEAQQDILRVLDVWEKNKIEKKQEYELEHEKAAIRRLFATAGAHTLVATAIFVEETVCAFGIDELLPNQFCISHFQKADTAYKGVYDFLIQQKARHFETLGTAYSNFEQDLGVENLRRSKMAYRPVDFLKKYIVTLSV
jgi:hypothetical protein